MDKIMKFAGAAAVMTAMLVSCQKSGPAVGNQKMVEIKVMAGSDIETKTTLDADGRVVWNAEGERLAIFQSADGEISKVTSGEGISTDGGNTMAFSVSLAENTNASNFGYYALYPDSAHIETSPEELDRIKVSLQTVQNPTGISFGTDADVLISKPIDGLQEQPATLSLQFARVISVGKMTVRNLASGGNVSRIIFTAPGKAVTGNSEISLVTGKASAYGCDGTGVDNVVLDYTGQEIAANGMTAYFTVWPFSLVPGDTFSVTVETQSLSFTKTVTLAEGKSLAFNEGRASIFTVDFTGVEGIELEEPPVDLSANGTANTYIVTNPSTRYSFNASVKGNGIHRDFYGTELEENLKIEPKSVLLFWYNCLQTDAKWKDECPVVVGSIELVDGKIRFETPEDFVEGNVIIAAFAEEGVTYDSIEADADGIITNATMLWSWNIWAVRDYVPEECGITVGSYVMMDRNLGALRNELTDDCPKDFTAPFTIGNYYQWGRKDPFPHHADSRNYYPFYFNKLATTPTYTPVKALQNTITDAAGTVLEKQIFSNEGISISGLNATKIAYRITKGEDDYVASVTRAIRNPHKFITDCDVFPNWLPNQGADTNTFELWGDPTNGDDDDAVKTIYDPCPAGWRLWTKSTIMEMKKVSETDPPYKVSDYGVYLSGSYFAFNGGYRNAANGTNLFNLGYVVKPQADMPFIGWTATSDCMDYYGMQQKYYNWQLKNDNVTFDLPDETTQTPNSASAVGRTVRCVKE